MGRTADRACAVRVNRPPAIERTQTVSIRSASSFAWNGTAGAALSAGTTGDRGPFVGMGPFIMNEEGVGASSTRRGAIWRGHLPRALRAFGPPSPKTAEPGAGKSQTAATRGRACVTGRPRAFGKVVAQFPHRRDDPTATEHFP